MKQQNLPTKTRQFTLVMAVTVGLILIVALMVGLIPGQRLFPTLVAHAQGTINVTTTNDEYGTNPGACSLREAIESINTNSSFVGCNNPGGAADTIQLQDITYTLTITGDSYEDNSFGSLAPMASMTIRGAGAGRTVVSAATDLDDWVFEIVTDTSPIAVAMEGLTVQGGPDGGIKAELYYNKAAGSSVSFTDMVVQNNQGAGIMLGGYAYTTTFVLTNMIIRNNQNDSGGGGLYAYYGGKTILNNATINDNKGSYGGGIYYSDQYGTDALQMTNVTIYSNTAQYNGGGLYLSYATDGAGSTATNVTLANNRVISGTGGNIYNNNSILNLKNTIVAHGMIISGTVDNNCAGNPGPNITSQGYNLDSGNTCGLSATGDIVNTNPLLDSALADNGGSTPTLALLAGSPAINKGTCTGAPSTDQRGYPRPDPISHQCDIGAYEYGSGIPIYLPIILKNY